MAFCLDVIDLNAMIRPKDGILKMDEITIMSEAKDASQQLLQIAEKQAQEIISNSRHQAQELVKNIEKNAFEDSFLFLNKIQNLQHDFLRKADSLMVEIALKLFDALTMQVTPSEKVEIVLKRILQEVPSKLVNPILKVNPKDAEFILNVDWEIKQDSSQPRGVVKLEAENGEWRMDFSAAVESLKAAFLLEKQENYIDFEQRDKFTK